MELINFYKTKYQTKGFTLIELLIVVALLALLSLIVLNAIPQMAKGRDGKRKADLSQLKVVLEDYYNDKGCYPRQDQVDCISNPPGLVPFYLKQIPCDPKGITYLYEADPGYNQANACPRWFRIYANLENPADTDITKVGCTSGCGPIMPNSPYNYGVSSDNIKLQGATGGPGGGDTADCPVGPQWWACVAGICNEIGAGEVDECTTYGGCYCTAAGCQSATGCR